MAADPFEGEHSWVRDRLKVEKGLGISGEVYELFAGTFGNVPTVVIKRGKSINEALINNDIRMLEQFSLTGCTQRILHVQESCSFTILVLERYEMNCEQWLTTHRQRRPREIRINLIIRDALKALEHLHSKGVVHRDIRMRSFAITWENGEYKAILTSLKYAWYEDRQFACFSEINKEYANKSWEFLPKDASSYSFIDDKYALTGISYYLLKDHMPPKGLRYPLHPVWPSCCLTDYRMTHLQNFIGVSLQGACNFRVAELSIPDLLAHPAFLPTEKLSAFEDGMYSIGKNNSRTVDPDLEEHRSIVFNGSWLCKLDLNISDHLRSYMDESKFVTLVVTKRNRKQHCNEDIDLFRHIFADLPDRDFEYWQSKFPRYFIYYFVKMARAKDRAGIRIHTKPELAQFFPASARFYRACYRALIEDPYDQELLPNGEVPTFMMPYVKAISKFDDFLPYICIDDQEEAEEDERYAIAPENARESKSAGACEWEWPDWN